MRINSARSRCNQGSGMPTNLAAIAHCPAGSEQLRLVLGELPADVDLAALAADLKEKPILKRSGGDRLAVIVPLQDGWAGWVFDVMPPVTELPRLVEKLISLSAGLTGNGAQPLGAAPTSGEGAALLAPVIHDLAAHGRIKRKALLQALVDAIVVHGLAQAAVVRICREKGGGAIVASDQALLSHADEIGRLFEASRGTEACQIDIRANSHDMDTLEAALLAEAVGAETLTLQVPARGVGGVALLFIGAAPEAMAQTHLLAELAALALGLDIGEPEKRHVRLFKAGLAVAIAGLVVFMCLPIPLTITAPALSEPDTAVIAALPFDSFLQSVTVDVGDRVTEGEQLAKLTAPDLEAQQLQGKLQLSVQQIAASAALAQNDYGAYKLARQRIETIRAQVRQFDDQLEQLNVAAPAAGTVIRTIGSEALGRFVATGQEIAIIQPDARYAVRLVFSRMDAPLIKAGQGGEVFFRGLNGRSYPFTVLTPAFVDDASDASGDDEQQLVARASITVEGEGDLMAGLSGFARVEAGSGIRIVVLSRYLVEYLRMTAWSYLGLRF
ncbi:HlyD family efflux transporter periplasmic adaptor subunit [Rhodobacterales bacterium]|nr:HlyD family efflux transporter periplasmic adaptor subunit [Rhodobacterales bacterium]